jgi:hypothetical protein
LSNSLRRGWASPTTGKQRRLREQSEALPADTDDDRSGKGNGHERVLVVPGERELAAGRRLSSRPVTLSSAHK